MAGQRRYPEEHRRSDANPTSATRPAQGDRQTSPQNFLRPKLDETTSRYGRRSPSGRSRRRSPSRTRSRPRDAQRRPDLSPARLRDDDLYRPSRKRDSKRADSPSPSRIRHYSPHASSHRRAPSRSPRRDSHRGHPEDRTARADKGSAKARQPHRENDKPRSPRFDHDHHSSRYTSSRRRSPDLYAPAPRRRSRTPLASSYRPHEPRRHERSLTPPKHYRGLSPHTSKHRDSRNQQAPPKSSPHRDRYRESFAERSSGNDDRSSRRRSPSPRQRRPSVSPPRKRSRREEPRRLRRGRSLERASNGDLFDSKDKRAESPERKMRGSYAGYGARGGSSRPPYHDPRYASPFPPPPPSQYSPPPPPYSVGRPVWPPGTPVPPPGFVSQHGYVTNLHVLRIVCTYFLPALQFRTQLRT